MPKTFESKKKKTASSTVKDNLSKQFGGSINRLEMGSSYKGINKSSQMFCGKAMKNSSLPSQSSLLSSNTANSGSTSSSLIALKKSQAQKTTCNENSMWLFSKNEKSKKMDNKPNDYSNAISRMFSDGLSDSEDSTHELSHFTELPKLGNYSLPSSAKVALSECTNDNRTKKETSIVPALIKRETARVEKNKTKTKLIENAAGLMPSLTDHRSVFYKSAKINQNEDENLKLSDLFKNIEENSIIKPAQVDNVSCTSFHLYKPPNELLNTDSEHIGSQLSNISSISLSPIEFDRQSSEYSMSFEQESQPDMKVKDSSFKISQAMYLQRRKLSLIKKKDRNKRKLSSRIYNSVIKEEQKSVLENRSPVKLNFTFSPEYKYESFVGEEKHLGNFYLSKQPTMLEDVDFSDIHTLKKTTFSSKKEQLKRRNVFDQNHDYIDTKVGKACNTFQENCQVSTTINIPENSFPKIEHLSIDSLPGTSNHSSNISDFSTSRCSTTDSFSSISKNVQTFVKEWLDDQDKIEASTGNDYLGRLFGTNEIPRKRRRHDLNSTKYIEHCTTLDPEEMLSNYSCEYDETYKTKAFHPN